MSLVFQRLCVCCSGCLVETHTLHGFVLGCGFVKVCVRVFLLCICNSLCVCCSILGLKEFMCVHLLSCVY